LDAVAAAGPEGEKPKAEAPSSLVAVDRSLRIEN